MTKSSNEKPTRRRLYYVILLLVAIVLSLIALVVPLYAPLTSPSLQAGQVSPEDIRAPQPISFESQVLTERQQDAAERSVPSIYTSPDTSVARKQLENLRSALAYITSVRADEYASQEQKMADLAALEDINLDQETAQRILDLSDSRWQAVQQEAIIVLEQVMRSTIREDRMDEARRSVPALVSLSLPEDQSEIVANLVVAFVAPNSLYSEELTEAARQNAREAVEPATVSYKTGETIVRRGQVLSETDLEALRHLGLAQPQFEWVDFGSIGVLVALAAAFMVFYFRREQSLAQDVRGLTMIAFLFLSFLLAARLVIPGHTVLPYLFPLPAYALIVAIFFGAEPALLTALPLTILVTYNLPNALDLIIFYILGSFFGVLTIGRAHRMTSFIWAGAAIAASSAVVVVAYRLPQPNTDLLGISTLTGAAAFNGLASAVLTVLLQFFLAQFLGMTTALQLMEISRPDHPLLQLLLRTAPGTYQHSLQVANLAEQAAEQIDADALLTRVGALYHDIGKLNNPIFFIENQAPGSPNPHDDLDPHRSSQIIIRHVTDGGELAREHRLPSRIHDFIFEHHGTMLTRYQYVKAVEAAGGDENRVDKDDFRYPGPRPQTQETAILMLADGCEARTRAGRPENEAELNEMVKGVIDARVDAGQLDDTDLTLRDLDLIRESFTATLKGIYHPRIEYPKLKEKPAAQNSTPTVPVGERGSLSPAFNPEPRSETPSPNPENPS